MSEMTNRIDKMLRQRGIKKQDFYDAIGISSMTYSKWSRDLVTPRPENIRMIADFFGVSIPFLQYGIEDSTQKTTAAPASDGLTDAQIELLKIARLLDDESVRYLTAKARELEEFRRFRDSQG